MRNSASGLLQLDQQGRDCVGHNRALRFKHGVPPKLVARQPVTCPRIRRRRHAALPGHRSLLGTESVAVADRVFNFVEGGLGVQARPMGNQTDHLVFIV